MARIIQLLARLIGVILTAIAAKLQLDAPNLEPVSEAVAVAIVALAAFGFDLYSHRRQQKAGRKRRRQ